MNFKINELSLKLLDKLLNDYSRLNIIVKKGTLGCNIIDAGINTKGSIEAGLLISSICLGGLGQVTLSPSNLFDTSSIMQVNVHASHPVIACLGSQYAGWSLSSENFFALGSGPVRSLAQKEKIFETLQFKETNSKTICVLEVNTEPPEEIVKKVSIDCKIKPENLFFILTPTTSICGNLQVVARVLEVAIHKAHELNFPTNLWLLFVWRLLGCNLRQYILRNWLLKT